CATPSPEFRPQSAQPTRASATSERSRRRPLERGGKIGAGTPWHADCDYARALPQAAVAPFAGEDFAGDMRRAEALRHAVDVVALEAVRFVPFIAAETFAPVAAIRPLEAVDALAVLEPLQHAAPFLLALRAGAAPRRPVVWI